MRLENLLELRDRLNKLISRYTEKLEDINLRSSEYSPVIKPPMDVYSDGNRQLVYVETPDIIKKTLVFKMDTSSNSLTFSASKGNAEKKEKNHRRNYMNMDRKAGKYSRKIPLTADSSVSSVKHSYKLGVLKIEIIYKGQNHV
ncbi:MAG: Hsp20 family protein [bacterium]